MFNTSIIGVDVLVVLFVLDIGLFYVSVRFSRRIIRDHTGVWFLSTYLL